MKALVLLALFGLLTACYNQPRPDLPDSASNRSTLIGSPDRERGLDLYTENCVPCHGAEGHGDGWRVKELEGPKPRDFHNDRTMGRMSPSNAYAAITNGVPRSTMTAFDLISPDDRWHLAFYVLSLAHTEESAERGNALVTKMKIPSLTPRQLSELGNQEIITDMLGRGQSLRSSTDILAYFRQAAPYQNLEFGLGTFRNEVGKAMSAYRKGDHENAKSILSASYLDNLDSHLKLILSHQSGLVLQIEMQVRALRIAFEKGLPIGEIAMQAQELTASLDAAAPLLAKVEANSGVALGAATTLSFAIDGALFLFLLITLVSRRGADKRERKVLAFGIATGIATSTVIVVMWSSGMFDGSIRTTASLALSALVTISSLLMVVGVVRHFRCPPQTRTIAAPSGLLLLFLFSASVIVRDTLEVVPAIRLLPSSSLWIGALAATAALGVLIGLLVALERRLEISSRTALLAITASLIAIISAGGFARAAQMSRLLSTDQAGTMHSPWLSLWPTSQGVLIQLLVAACCTLLLIVFTLLPTKSVQSA